MQHACLAMPVGDTYNHTVEVLAAITTNSKASSPYSLFSINSACDMYAVFAMKTMCACFKCSIGKSAL